MKKIGIIIIALLIVSGIVWIAGIKSTESISEKTKAKPVKTIVLKESDSPRFLDYTGIMNADEIKKLGFKTGGRIASVNVKKGQRITPGTVLMRLDPVDLQLSVKGSEAQMKAANSQYTKALNGATPEESNQLRYGVEKAQNAYKFSKSNYDKYSRLYQEGIISQQEMEKVRLDFEVKEAELKQATEAYKRISDGTRIEDKQSAAAQLEQATTEYQYKKNLLAESVLKSDIYGYVVDVLFERGEMVSAGYPVVVIRNERQLVQVGLSQNDLLKVKTGMNVDVLMNDIQTNGVITHIAQLPDDISRTYTTDILINDSQLNLPLGAVLNVHIPVGNSRGIWLPITAVLSNQEDYVFVIENGKAVKRLIQLGEVRNDLVHVTGLKNGEILVVEGLKRLTDGDPVNPDSKE